MNTRPDAPHHARNTPISRAAAREDMCCCLPGMLNNVNHHLLPSYAPPFGGRKGNGAGVSALIERKITAKTRVFG